MKTFLQIWLFIPAIYAGLLALHTGTHLLNSFDDDCRVAGGDKVRIYVSWIFRFPFIVIFGAARVALITLLPAIIIYLVIQNIS